MRSTISILEELASKYSQFTFQPSESFKWSHENSIIFYNIDDVDFNTSIIHELSHALLCHKNYNRDIELLKMESEAWDKTKLIARQHGIEVDDETIQLNLDSYRDWLHKRSTCPHCQSIGVQYSDSEYRCLVCHGKWNVNEAKKHRLKRIKI